MYEHFNNSTVFWVVAAVFAMAFLLVSHKNPKTKRKSDLNDYSRLVRARNVDHPEGMVDPTIVANTVILPVASLGEMDRQKMIRRAEDQALDALDAKRQQVDPIRMPPDHFEVIQGRHAYLKKREKGAADSDIADQGYGSDDDGD